MFLQKSCNGNGCFPPGVATLLSHCNALVPVCVELGELQKDRTFWMPQKKSSHTSPTIRFELLFCFVSALSGTALWWDRPTHATHQTSHRTLRFEPASPIGAPWISKGPVLSLFVSFRAYSPCLFVFILLLMTNYSPLVFFSHRLSSLLLLPASTSSSARLFPSTCLFSSSPTCLLSFFLRVRVVSFVRGARVDSSPAPCACWFITCAVFALSLTVVFYDVSP